MALTRHTLFARCTHKLIDYSEPIRRFSLTTLASRLVSCSLNNSFKKLVHSQISPAFDHYDFLLPRDQIVGLLLDNSLDVEM
jgi:hypothetical protein